MSASHTSISPDNLISPDNSISPDKLSRLIGTAAAPALIDIRIGEDFSAGPHLVPGLTGGEVNPVILALRTHGIEVTALHSDMLDEQPRWFFMHFRANDNAVKLAEGLRGRRQDRQHEEPSRRLSEGAT
jgi:hypothetical protein